MTAQAEPTTKAYCNVLALEKGLDPAGHAGSFNDAVLIETPLPWKKDIYQQADPLPQEALNLMALWLQRYHETGEYGHRPLLIAPDTEYSRPGLRWVMFYTHKPGAFAHYDKVSYSVPVDEVGPLLWAWYESPADLPRFDAYRAAEADSQREILVCTHGTIDAACAKFGYPLYNGLRRQHADTSLRVWRVSHFGGHVFAPTLMDMPTGHYWAYVEEAQARQIAARDGEVSTLRGHYRGWAGLKSSLLQAAEYELWQRHGWAWFGYDKRGDILAQDDTDPEDPLWADVRITHTTPDGAEVAHMLRVEVRGYVETITTTGYDKTYNYPQYVVTACERVG